MTELKRWDPGFVLQAVANERIEMEEVADGDYVLFTDYSAKCADTERLREALERAIEDRDTQTEVLAGAMSELNGVSEDAMELARGLNEISEAVNNFDKGVNAYSWSSLWNSADAAGELLSRPSIKRLLNPPPAASDAGENDAASSARKGKE